MTDLAGTRPNATRLIHLERDDDVSRALAKADPRLARVIDDVGCLDFGPVGEPFEVLVRSVVSQQLSGKSAESIFARLADNVGITPEALASADDAELRRIGLSHRKAEYIQGIARQVASGELDLDELALLDDETVSDRLVKVRGIGPWSAHMFLMFALRRPDVLANDDYGIRQAVGTVLGLGRPATTEELAEAAEPWRPHRSAALFYLWAASDGGLMACEPRE